MKDSGVEWIGQCPAHWKINRTKYVFQIVKRIAGEEGYDILSVTQKGLRIKDITNNEGQIANSYKNYQFVYPNDFVMNHMDLLTGWIDISKFFGVTSPDYRVFQLCNTDDNSLIYFKHVMQNCYLNRTFYSMGQGVSNMGRWRLSTSVFCNFSIPVPPHHEQESIASFLDTKCAEIDKVVEKTRESIEEYKKLKQAVITEAVTKGVRGPRPMKPSGVEWIGDIPAEWEIFSLRYIGSCQNGISKGGEYFGQGYPFISYSDVYKNITLPTSPTGLVETTTEEQERYSVQCGDIFFTRTSETIEEIGITSVCCASISRATFAGFLIRVRPYNEQILPHYSKYYFRSEIHRRFFVKEMNIVTRASLSQDLLKRMPVLLPDRNEQQEIADYLDAKCEEIDRLISKKEQLIAELEAYKKSLIYEYVTGKKEVPA